MFLLKYLQWLFLFSVSNGVNSLQRRFHSESEDSNYATPAGSLQHI